MPQVSKRKKNRKSMFRDFLHRNNVENNYLKYYRKKSIEVSKKYDISVVQLQFICWAYDLEFFTIYHAAEDNEYSYPHVENRIIYPLLKKGLLYKYYDKLSPSAQIDKQMFDENKFNYRVRYALTQKARNAVKLMYD